VDEPGSPAIQGRSEDERRRRVPRRERERDAPVGVGTRVGMRDALLADGMATFHVQRRNVHFYLVAILVLAALTVVLATLAGHKSPPRSRYVEAKGPAILVPT
jgi:hypothetical protein